MGKRLYRSQRERIIAGVAGGIGEHFDIDPVWVRLAFVLTAFASGFGLIAYIVMWIIVPRQSTQATPREAVEENLGEVKERLKEAEASLRSAFSRRTESPPSEAKVAPEKGNRSAYWLGLILIVSGAMLLLNNLAAFWWFSWGRFWPVLFILAGIVILLGMKKR